MSAGTMLASVVGVCYQTQAAGAKAAAARVCGVINLNKSQLCAVSAIVYHCVALSGRFAQSSGCLSMRSSLLSAAPRRSSWCAASSVLVYFHAISGGALTMIDSALPPPVKPNFTPLLLHSSYQKHSAQKIAYLAL
jgi:hypothetical protein